MTTSPARGIMVSIIYPAFVAPWFPRSVYALKYSVYSSRLACSRAWFTTALSKADWSYSCLLWRLSTKTGRWIHRHMVWTDSACWDSGADCRCPATCHRACVNQKRPMNLLYCCFVTLRRKKRNKIHRQWYPEHQLPMWPDEVKAAVNANAPVQHI